MALDNDTTTDQPTPPPKSTARIIVENIEAFWKGNAPDGVKRYRIQGASGGVRELERYSHDELIRLHQYWSGILANERRRPDIRYAI